MKKIFIIIINLTLILSVIGCSNNESKESKEAENITNESEIMKENQNDEKKAISNNSNIFDIYNWNET